MFGSVIGMRSENIRKTRLVFAEYARDTILLVDNDFNDPNASERAKKLMFEDWLNINYQVRRLMNIRR